MTSEEFTHRLEIHSNGQSQIKLTCLNEDVGKSRMRMTICCSPRGKAPGGKNVMRFKSQTDRQIDRHHLKNSQQVPVVQTKHVKSLLRTATKVKLMTKIRCVESWNKTGRTEVSAQSLTRTIGGETGDGEEG